MVGVPDTRNHLGARRRGTALGPGEAEHQAGGHAGLTEGRVAVGILGAEAELEAGARVGAPDLRGSKKKKRAKPQSATPRRAQARKRGVPSRRTLAMAGRPPRVWAARAGEDG